MTKKWIEVATAASLLLPTLTLLHAQYQYFNLTEEPEWPRSLLLLAACVHLPSSVAYHLSVGLLGRDRLDNDLRRLDQTMQHVSVVLVACALSRGSSFYTCFTAGFNTPLVLDLWNPRVKRPAWPGVFTGMLVYLLPMTLNPHGVHHLVVAFATAIAGGTAAFLVPPRWIVGTGSVLMYALVAVHARTLDAWLTLDLRNR